MVSAKPQLPEMPSWLGVIPWTHHLTILSGTKDIEEWEEAQKRMKVLSPMRQDLIDGEPDFDSDFAILRDKICQKVLTENVMVGDSENEWKILCKNYEQFFVLN